MKTKLEQFNLEDALQGRILVDKCGVMVGELLMSKRGGSQPKYFIELAHTCVTYELLNVNQDAYFIKDCSPWYKISDRKVYLYHLPKESKIQVSLNITKDDRVVINTDLSENFVAGESFDKAAENIIKDLKKILSVP